MDIDWLNLLIWFVSAAVGLGFGTVGGYLSTRSPLASWDRKQTAEARELERKLWFRGARRLFEIWESEKLEQQIRKLTWRDFFFDSTRMVIRAGILAIGLLGLSYMLNLVDVDISVPLFSFILFVVGIILGWMSRSHLRG